MADSAYQPTPWVDTMIEERHLLDGLVGICLNNGWTKVAEFTKVTYLNRLTKPTIKRFYLPLANPVIEIPKTLHGDYYVYLDGEICPTSYYSVVNKDEKTLQLTFHAGVTGMAAIYYSTVQAMDDFDFYVAKHVVVRNASGNLFGFAQLAHVNTSILYTGCKVPFVIYDPDADYGTQLRPQDEGIFSWVVQKANEDGLFERSTLYTYQLEKWIGNGKMMAGWDNDVDGALKRLSLDVEIQTSMWGLDDATNNLQFKITDKFPQMYQSPIVTTHMRVPQLENTTKIATIDVKYTNWWEDSKVIVKGFIDGKSLMLIILADTSPVWDRNAVPAVPIYMGDFDTDDTKEEVVNREITFDFYKSTVRSSTIISSRPMVNQGSYVRVWLMGDVNGDFPEEWVKLTIAGQEIGNFNVTGDYVPTGDKNDAQFIGQFDITEIEGKNSVSIEAESGDGVSGFNPIGARMWLEIVIHTDKTADGVPSALFSGSALTKPNADIEAALKATAKFDYDDVSLKQEVLLPKMKDYPHYPSNGIDSVMVKRTKFGARYQAHYISWGVPANSMPPLRQDEDGHKYPRAWNNYMNDPYKFQFNPSRYSGKAHSSRATLVHPEDGKFGTLRNVILVSPLTIMNGDELKANKERCSPNEEDRFEIYSYYLVEGVSPLTKRPATPFRPAGLGILKSGYVLPEIPPLPPAPPEFLVTIDPVYSVIEEDSSMKFVTNYSRHSPLTNFKWEVSSNVNRGTYSAESAVYTFNSPGTYSVKFTVWNELGQSGIATATIVVIAKPVPPPPPPPPPPPNTLQCGQTNDTGGGVYTEKFHEMGNKAGKVQIDYDMYSAPDKMDVYYMNQLLATTNVEVAGKGSLVFSYTPVNGVTQIKVIVTNTTGNSQWEYLVKCPI
ncbi:hypothetical protein GRF59_05565 [Paenibacillus sp. HJL G12]|uniref:PKD domain-containing protein n=1 Tax=Paenibacillus dendrobii TaxID=2691084 RepID=A0A7X3IFS0_9BACL|nr:PKD domain-containing protein [Paenibacillus dendrobii]MWV43092.1 hypothetical protein [Paenibacillus dendrobii]